MTKMKFKIMTIMNKILNILKKILLQSMIIKMSS